MKTGSRPSPTRRTRTRRTARRRTKSPPCRRPWVPGTRFSSYEIESRLATGGMAEVWRANIKGVEGFEKRIVIKTMLTHLHQRPELVEMFVSEASLAARLSHPNIVDVLDFGQLEGRYFIAMEYVSGITLRLAHRRMLAARRRLPILMVLHVLSDVCEALQHMHELGDADGRAWPHSPRPQPRERDHLDQRLRQADRFRRRARDRAHAARPTVRRQVSLFGARADCQPRRGPPQRRVLGRRHPVRVPRRATPVRRRGRRSHPGGDDGGLL